MSSIEAELQNSFSKCFNSLSAHIHEVRSLLDYKFLDVLAIQETKLNNSHRDSKFYIPGFDLVRRDRISDGGGGVCFYIKSSIIFSVRNDLNIADRENLCIEVPKPQSKPLIVVKQGIGHQIPLFDYMHTLRTLTEN